MLGLVLFLSLSAILIGSFPAAEPADTAVRAAAAENLHAEGPYRSPVLAPESRTHPVTAGVETPPTLPAGRADGRPDPGRPVPPDAAAALAQRLVPVPTSRGPPARTAV